MVNGNNIFISLDEHSAPFAATKANEIQVGAEKIPISSPNTGEWEEHIVGRKKWGFSISWLVGEIADIKKLLMVGKTYTITVCGRNGNTVTALLQGRATCMDVKVGLTRGTLATGSFSFDGNGMLYIPVTSITLSPSSLSLDVGSSQQLTPTIEPSDATSQAIMWTSSDTSIATVDNNGLVTGVGAGTCTITATAKDGSGVKATCSCEVHNVMVSGITLSESSITLAIYEVSQNPVTAEVSPNNATNKHIEWSGNSAALSIVQNGEDYSLEGLATGQFELIASATDGSGITATCIVNIYQP